MSHAWRWRQRRSDGAGNDTSAQSRRAHTSTRARKARERYVTNHERGHSMRPKTGWHHSEATRAKIGAASRAARLRDWQDPVVRARRIAALRASWTPERRARHGEITRAAIAEHRARRETGEAA